MNVKFNTDEHQMEAVLLKGKKEGLIVYLDSRLNFTELCEKIREKFKSTNFFWGTDTQMVVNSGEKKLDLEQKNELKKIFKNFNLEIKKFVSDQDCKEKTKNKEVQEVFLSRENILTQGPTLIVKKNLRSGQTLRHDGTLVILGDVNPGAEVIANGHILVIGNLRGIAHAGAKGDRQAIVFANRLQPTQLRIADIITRAPDEDDLVPTEPEIASVKGDRVIIEKFV